MCKASGIKHAEALNELAQLRGFKSWERLLEQSKKPLGGDQPPSPLHFL